MRQRYPLLETPHILCASPFLPHDNPAQFGLPNAAVNRAHYYDLLRQVFQQAHGSKPEDLLDHAVFPSDMSEDDRQAVLDAIRQYAEKTKAEALAFHEKVTQGARSR